MSPAALAHCIDRRAWQRDIDWCRREWLRRTLARLESALLLPCDGDAIPAEER